MVNRAIVLATLFLLGPGCVTSLVWKDLDTESDNFTTMKAIERAAEGPGRLVFLARYEGGRQALWSVDLTERAPLVRVIEEFDGWVRWKRHIRLRPARLLALDPEDGLPEGFREVPTLRARRSPATWCPSDEPRLRWLTHTASLSCTAEGQGIAAVEYPDRLEWILFPTRYKLGPAQAEVQQARALTPLAVLADVATFPLQLLGLGVWAVTWAIISP